MNNELSKEQIVAAVTNHPSHAPDSVTLGGRTFPILDLEYDQYIEFAAMLEPLFKGVAGGLMRRSNISVPGIDISSLPTEGFTPGNLMKFAKGDLPRMVQLVLNMNAVVSGDKSKEVTVAWIKQAGKNPMVLAGIVMKQVTKNNMIGDFADFFVQMLPTIMAMSRLMNAKPSTTPSEQPSPA
jgi:hypothetical protein